MTNIELRVRLLCAILSHCNEKQEWAVDYFRSYAAEDWLQLLTLANRTWLGTSLAHTLQELSLWTELDEELKAYLQSLVVFSRHRNQSIKEHAIQLQNLMRQHGIEIIWLKGGSALFNGIDKPVGRRWMMDLDLLVHENEIDRVLKILQQHDYHPSALLDDPLWKHGHHAPGMHTPDHQLNIEVHFRLFDDNFNAILPRELCFQYSQTLNLDGIEGRELSPTEQIVHTLIHDQLAHKNWNHKTIHLRQLIHLSWLINHFQSEIDWEKIQIQINHPDMLECILYVCWVLMGLNTPLTDQQSKSGQRYWQHCLQRQSEEKHLLHFRFFNRLVKSFQPASINNRYQPKSVYGWARAYFHHVQGLLSRRKNFESRQKMRQFRTAVEQNLTWRLEAD
ncbi:MAG: nucleotidyltransferase family protein [Gammaproteobacteria bacterium]|jgi:hypothetical protein|nr:nucleotidyltransferase family protein [Gammaproteobacteria bacterium]MBT6553177.1 nucleotidyltransferase family protein [Gammaproteobacteria bacterium]MBT7047318.1 nucleotidyltransferase family protein [Gammaproteobacteria bacterium]